MKNTLLIATLTCAFALTSAAQSMESVDFTLDVPTIATSIRGTTFNSVRNLYYSLSVGDRSIQISGLDFEPGVGVPRESLQVSKKGGRSCRKINHRRPAPTGGYITRTSNICISVRIPSQDLYVIDVSDSSDEKSPEFNFTNGSAVPPSQHITTLNAQIQVHVPYPRQGTQQCEPSITKFSATGKVRGGFASNDTTESPQGLRVAQCIVKEAFFPF